MSCLQLASWGRRPRGRSCFGRPLANFVPRASPSCPASEVVQYVYSCMNRVSFAWPITLVLFHLSDTIRTISRTVPPWSAPNTPQARSARTSSLWSSEAAGVRHRVCACCEVFGACQVRPLGIPRWVLGWRVFFISSGMGGVTFWVAS